MEEIKENTIKKEIVEYSVKCSKCGKEIKGSTENQVRYNLEIHKLSKGCKNDK